MLKKSVFKGFFTFISFYKISLFLKKWCRKWCKRGKWCKVILLEWCINK